MLTIFSDTDIDDFAKGLEAVFHGKATILNRMRLSCTFYDKDTKAMDNDGAYHEYSPITLITSIIQSGRS